MGGGEIVAVLAVAKIGGGVDVEAVLATAKTGDVAVRGWGGGSATQEGEIFVVLAVAVVTAKTGGLLAKNIAKRGDSGDKNIENNLF